MPIMTAMLFSEAKSFSLTTRQTLEVRECIGLYCFAVDPKHHFPREGILAACRKAVTQKESSIPSHLLYNSGRCIVLKIRLFRFVWL